MTQQHRLARVLAATTSAVVVTALSMGGAAADQQAVGTDAQQHHHEVGAVGLADALFRGTPRTAPGSGRTIGFPGAKPWERVPPSRVGAECGLSRRLLKKAEPEMSRSPYAIVRYGKLCWVGGDEEAGKATLNVNSASKSFGALLFGRVAAVTDVDEQTVVSDWLTAADVMAAGSDDPIGAVQQLPPANPLATVFNVLTQTGHNPLLGYGTRVPWSYDAVGLRGMNSIVPFMDTVIAANPDAFPGSTTAKEMAVNDFFKPLGMSASRWPGVVVAHTLESNIYDMARLGLLTLRQGRWGAKQLIDPDYIYRLSHPQIEDIHTGYGYLTWLNSDQGQANLFTFQVDRTCSPFAGWPTYPHAPTFDSPGTDGGSPFDGGYDDGVYWFDGAGGQYTEVHRGLDLVLVTRDDEAAQASSEESQEIGAANPSGLEYHRLWRLMRPALVAKDPKFRGDEKAFCAAYRSNQYAPDLVSPWKPGDGFGSSHLGDRTQMTPPASLAPVVAR